VHDTPRRNQFGGQIKIRPNEVDPWWINWLTEPNSNGAAPILTELLRGGDQDRLRDRTAAGETNPGKRKRKNYIYPQVDDEAIGRLKGPGRLGKLKMEVFRRKGIVKRKNGMQSPASKKDKLLKKAIKIDNPLDPREASPGIRSYCRGDGSKSLREPT